MGTIVGGMKGQRSEAGMLDGAGKGAISGAIAALELLDFVADDAHHEPMSKVNMLSTYHHLKYLYTFAFHQ